MGFLPIGRRRRATSSGVRAVSSSEDEEQSVAVEVPAECELTRTISKDITMRDFQSNQPEDKEKVDEKNLPVKKRKEISRSVREVSPEPRASEREMSGESRTSVEIVAQKNKDKVKVRCVAIDSDIDISSENEECGTIDKSDNRAIDTVSVTSEVTRIVSPTDKETDTREVESVANSNTHSSRGAASGASGANVASVSYSRVGRLDRAVSSIDRVRSSVDDVLADIDVSSGRIHSALKNTLRGYLFAEIKNMAANSQANLDDASGESINSLTTSEILERSRVIRERIVERLRAAEECRGAIKTYRMLCLAESKLSRNLASSSDSQRDPEESVRSREALELV